MEKKKPTIRNLIEFMWRLKSRTFFYDDELLELARQYDLEYTMIRVAMNQVGSIELFTYSGERMHFRNVYHFKEDGTPDE